MTPKPPAEDAHRALIAEVLWLVEEQRAVPKRSGGWPRRRAWEAERARWPLHLQDPERAILWLWRVASWEERRYRTPPGVRAAVRAVYTALVLEDA